MLNIFSKIFHTVFCMLGLCLLLLMPGCATEQGKFLQPLSETPEFIKNAAVVKAELSSLKNVATFITDDTYDVYRYAPHELARRMKAAGINQCHLIISNRKLKYFGEDDFRKFITTLKSEKIKFWLAFDDRNFHGRNARRLPHLKNISKHSALFAQIQTFMDFNDESEPQAQFNGVTMILSPHLMKSGSGNNHLYAWSEHNYGIGYDNDKLVIASVELARQVSQQIAPLQFAVMVPGFLHLKKSEGQLSTGGIEDFVDFTDLMIISSFAPSLKKSMAQANLHIFTAAKLKMELIPCILAHDDHYREIPDSICRGTFSFFADDLHKTLPAMRSTSGFSGIAIMYWRGLEILLEKYN